MSASRWIRVLYTITFTIFYFILWGIMSKSLDNVVNYKLFIITVIASLLTQYLSRLQEAKVSNKIRSFIVRAVPLVTALLALYISYGKRGLFINAVFVILNTLHIFNKVGERVDYSAYSIRLKRCVYTLAAVGLMLFFIDEQLRNTLLRFYMLFLISGIWLLRESRKYTYHIGKSSIWGNLGIILFVIVLTLDSVYKFIAVTLGNILQGVYFIVDKAILITAIVFVKCFGGVINFLSYKLKNLKPQSINLGSTMDNKYDPSNLTQGNALNPLVGHVIRGIIILLICYAAFRILRNYRYGKESGSSGIRESREKIIPKSSLKDKFSFYNFKDKFKTKDFRQQVLEIFKTFQVRTYKKDIFKEYMAAQELGRYTGEKLDNIEATKRLAELYNMSKFSEEEVTEHYVSEMKNIFNRIKDNIDKL
jgi:hypothetical protein